MKKRRHKRPRDAADSTGSLFPDLPRLIWCPYGEGHETEPKNFGKNASRPSGLQAYCKPCRKLRTEKDRKRAKRKDLVREMRMLRKRITKAFERAAASFEKLNDTLQRIDAAGKLKTLDVPHGNTDSSLSSGQPLQ